MAGNIIYIGDVVTPSFIFTDDDICRLAPEMAVSAAAEELSTDALEVEVYHNDTDGTLRSLEYGTKIYFYRDAVQIAKYYLTSVKQTGRQRFKIYATSLVGMIDNETSYGGIFFGATFQEAVNQIILSQGVESYKQLKSFRTQATEAQSSIYGVKLSDSGFGTATYSSKMRAQIVFQGANFISGQHTIVGDYHYGIQISRERMSASSPYLNKLRFRYGESSYAMTGPGGGQVVAGDVVTVELDPSVPSFKYSVVSAAGVVKWSGTSTPTVPADTTPLPLYITGGGADQGYGSVINPSVHACNIDYVYYEVDASAA